MRIQVLGLSVDDVIAGMGKVQLATFTELGYLPLINALGRTFYEYVCLTFLLLCPISFICSTHACMQVSAEH